MLFEMEASSLYKCYMTPNFLLTLSIASIIWVTSLDIPQKHKLSVDLYSHCLLQTMVKILLAYTIHVSYVASAE